MTKYYDDIGRMPAISDQDMNAMLAEESRVRPDNSTAQGSRRDVRTLLTWRGVKAGCGMDRNREFVLPFYYWRFISYIDLHVSLVGFVAYLYPVSTRKSDE